MSRLKRSDSEAYNYFYNQVKCDLIALRIRGLEYPIEKDRVAGLCVTIMKTEMVENALTCDEVMARYKKFMPAKYVRQHSMFIKNRVEKSLKNLARNDFDSK